MERQHRESIRMNYTLLLREMMVEKVSDLLFEMGFLTDYMKATVMGQLTQYDKARKLLEILPKRGPFMFTAFCISLESAGQFYLSHKLRDTLTKLAKVN